MTEPIERLFSIAGKRVVVTGGTRGIGLMIARTMVAAGARVIVVSRKAEAVAGVQAELGCAAVVADLAAPTGAVAVAEEVNREFGGALDVLINNAGATWGAPLETFPDSAWDRVLGLNVVGLFNVTVTLLPALRKEAAPDRPARVINIGSIDAIRMSNDENFSYSASKGAVHALTRHLAKRLAAEHVTVNAIAPGPFHSKMTAFRLDEPDARSQLEATIPLARIGEPDDIAGLAIFLSTRASAYMTGSVIALDGGYSSCS